MQETGLQARPLSELNRATAATITDAELEVLTNDLFTFKPWNDEKIAKGGEVKDALKEAYKLIIKNVPSCPTRTRALNCLIDARMLANAAITFDGAV